MQDNDNLPEVTPFEMPPAVQDMITAGIEPVEAFRTAKGLSIEELAELIGMPVDRLALFEADNVDLDWREVVAIGMALGVPPEILTND